MLFCFDPSSRFETCFWWHNCQATGEFCQQQGDCRPPCYLQDRGKGEKRKFKGDPSSLVGQKCGTLGCNYTVTSDTALLNAKGLAVRTIGGANLAPERDQISHMRCCHCKSEKFGGHLAKRVYEDGYCVKFHDCRHAREYRERLKTGDLETRLEGCSCVGLNIYDEVIADWLPPDSEGKERWAWTKDCPLFQHQPRKDGKTKRRAST